PTQVGQAEQTGAQTGEPGEATQTAQTGQQPDEGTQTAQTGQQPGQAGTMTMNQQVQDRLQLTAVVNDAAGREIRIEPIRAVAPPTQVSAMADGAFTEFGDAGYSGWFVGNVVVDGTTVDRNRLMYLSAS